MKVLVISTSRGDYGHLLPLVDEFAKDSRFEIQFLVLSSEVRTSSLDFTFSGVPRVTTVVQSVFLPESDEEWDHYLASLIYQVNKSLSAKKFDAVLLLGDRIELLGVVALLLSKRLPIIHLHGGEITSGVVDDMVRNAISKVASLHFVAYEQAGTRLIAMGEHPNRVIIAGALAVDNFHLLTLLDKLELEALLGIDLAREFILATYHPVTGIDPLEVEHERKIFFQELAESELQILITPPNQDPGNEKVWENIEKLASKHPSRVHVLPNLGIQTYYSLMRCNGLVVGNSSSGVIDAPIAGVKSIDFGARQKSRWRPPTVISVPARPGALLEVLNGPEVFLRPESATGYGSPGVSRRIVNSIFDKRHLLATEK